MLVSRSKTLIAALIASALIAGCGGADTESRQRNTALPGAQQCLSDEGTTIDSNGLVQLDFCAEAASFEIWQEDIRVAGPISITSNAMNNFQAPAGEHTFRVVSMSANDEQVGEDVVNTVTDSCSTGGACEIGDIGPGGGIVVYDAGEKMDWGQYIEIARKGWYDRTEGPSASDDPKGRFNCIPDSLGTDEALGQGKNNTDKMIAECKTPNLDNIDAFSLIDLYNSDPNTAKNDWAIPTPSDFLAIERSYSSINDLQLPQILATSSEAQNSGWIYLYSFGREYLLPCPGNCVFTTKQSGTRVRPVRYFASDGPVAPTVKVTGIMQTPAAPDPEAVPTSNGAPTDVNFEGAEQLKITWKSEGNTDGQEFLVEFRGDNNKEYSTKRVPCCEYSFSFDLFEANVSYSFVVSRIDENGDKISSMPISLYPVFSLFDSEGGSISNPSEENTSPPDISVVPEDETSSTVEQAEPPSSGQVDCTVAPTVDFPRNITTDDTVSFVVNHPCFGKYSDQLVNIGRELTDGDGNKSISSSMNNDFVGTSYSITGRFEKGMHTFRFYVWFSNKDNFIYSEEVRISFEVTQGDGLDDNVCNINRISLVGKTLRLNCPVVYRGTLMHALSGAEVQVESKGDQWSADLSGLSDGWHYMTMVIHHSLDFFVKEISVCITQCDLGTTFAPIDVQQEKDAATASLACTGYLYVGQMYKVNNQIYIQSLPKGSNTGELKIDLQPSTAALQFHRNCEEEGSKWFSTLASLNRSATPPTAEDVANNFNELVATISLPEITQGFTDLPVGPVSGGSFAVAAQAESLALTPDVVFELLDLTIAGSKVERVEISADGKKWVPGNFGDIELSEDASQLSIRLTAKDGSQTVITRDIDRSSSSTPTVDTASESGMGAMNFVFIALALLLLLAAAFAVKKKRATINKA